MGVYFPAEFHHQSITLIELILYEGGLIKVGFPPGFVYALFGICRLSYSIN